jgi:oxaloacetate decarboxylase gamma subunit
MTLNVDLISTAIEYMALGMGVVFLFLLIMVEVLKIQALVIQKFNKQSDVAFSSSSTKNNKDDKSKKIAAASAAIAFHNK